MTPLQQATSNLGKYSKRGAGLLVMGVGGGAAFPPMQGALADAKGTTLSCTFAPCTTQQSPFDPVASQAQR